jgi:hypothetical protein
MSLTDVCRGPVGLSVQGWILHNICWLTRDVVREGSQCWVHYFGKWEGEEGTTEPDPANATLWNRRWHTVHSANYPELGKLLSKSNFCWFEPLNGSKLCTESYPLTFILGFKSTESCPLATKVTLKLSLDFSVKKIWVESYAFPKKSIEITMTKFPYKYWTRDWYNKCNVHGCDFSPPPPSWFPEQSWHWHPHSQH